MKNYGKDGHQWAGGRMMHFLGLFDTDILGTGIPISPKTRMNGKHIKFTSGGPKPPREPIFKASVMLIQFLLSLLLNVCIIHHSYGT